MRPEIPATLSIGGGTFGAQGAMISAPRITEIHLFPLTVAVDTSVPPVFVASAGTGNWTSSFVTIDPEGTSRPLGGVKFVTDGGGLSPTDAYDLEFTMTSGVDFEYDMFAFEDETQEYLDFRIDTFGDIPVVSEWGLIVMALLVLAAGTVVVGRRRRIAGAAA